MWEGWWGMTGRQGSEQDAKRIIKKKSNPKFQVLPTSITPDKFYVLKKQNQQNTSLKCWWDGISGQM